MWARIAFLAVAAALLLASCGEGDDGDTGTAATAPAERPTQPQRDGGVALKRIGDFDRPDHVAQPPASEDLYVVEQPGRLQLLRGGRMPAETALDIADQVSDSGEQGLLSVAFPPDFQTSRLLYAYFTGNDQDQHVVEYRATEDGTVEEGSAREVLRMDDFASNHNGGLLLFGPDGQLYIGTGDGGGGGDPERNGQDLESPLGKILRIDPTVSSARPEVCNYGLRNPWRFSFDRETGALSIGDVGQNAQEEIDYVPAERTCGNNFGWSAFEGTLRFNEDQSAPNAVPPILTYELGGDRCAVTGGYVVRDPTLPSLNGRYVYGDYCAGELRSFEPTAKRAIDDRALGLNVPALASFGEDDLGRIYAVSNEGPIFRLVPR